jgi:molecular chaperone DnaK
VSYTIGIDVGSVTTCAAIMDGGEPQVLYLGAGAPTMPSYVAFVDGERMLVGAAAKRQAQLNPQRTVHSLKRLLGRGYAAPEVARAQAVLPFAIVLGASGEACVQIDGRDYQPEQLQAVLLQRVRELAEEYVGAPVTDAILAVPTHFRPVQRRALVAAAQLAGLRARSVVNEPVAAALAAAGGGAGDHLAVVDLGGTFNVSILGRDGGALTTRAAARDPLLGGDAFDERLVARLCAVFGATYGIDLEGDAMARQRLRDAAENAKRALSVATDVLIDLPALAQGPGGTIGFGYRLVRAELEALCAHLLARIPGPCEKALAAAGLARGDIDTLVLCGGMSHMPAVRAAVAAALGARGCAPVSPEAAVALGAAAFGRAPPAPKAGGGHGG